MAARQVEFENVHDAPISVHYIEHSDLDSPADHTLAPGEVLAFQSFVGHVFLTREVGSGNLLDWVEVEGHGHYEVGRDLPPSCKMEQGGEVCEDKEVTALRFVYGVLYRGRMSLNAIQPGRVPPFTQTGFERHKLPQEVYAPIRDFWLTQQVSVVWCDVDEYVMGRGGAWYLMHDWCGGLSTTSL